MPDTKQSTRRAHYVLSSHWDREWHHNFQDFRYLLVELLDHVIDGLESGRLGGPFTCDGQAIILEDYLEIRPEKRALIERLVRSGQLVVGPWYDLSDEFLVSGESLIRNLQRGHRIARELGGTPSKAGWVCDLFGHASQLPQILRGFGVEGAFLWRGIAAGGGLWKWQGADGSELVCYRFGPRGYCTFAFNVRNGIESGDHEKLTGARDEKHVELDLQAYLNSESQRIPVGPILLFDGGDHQGWDENTYNVLRRRMGSPQDGFEIVHSTLDGFLAELQAVAGEITNVVKGELREAGRQPLGIEEDWVIPGVLSSRVWIKQENARCQSLLCQWAEPFSALANQLLGREWPATYLDTAWKWLLQNHPHDSICGCSIDAVHEDMKYRFRQCHQIAERLTTEATASLTAAVEGEIGEGELRIGVFNPNSKAFEGTAEIVIPVPASWPCFNEFFGFEPQPGFELYASDGSLIPFQRLAQHMNRPAVYFEPLQMPQGRSVHHVKVALRLSIAALGFTTITACRLNSDREMVRYPVVPSIVVADNTLENELLRVEVLPNGSLQLTDKSSGQVYERLLTFEDSADIGDGWYHGQAVADAVVSSVGSSASIQTTHSGPQLGTLSIFTNFEVPAEFDFVASRRSRERTGLRIETRISLRPNQKWLEVEIEIENTAKDHRLRVLLPSGAGDAHSYWADSAFDVVERPIELRADNHLCRELEVETKPQTSWTAVKNAQRGLAIVCSGDLLESAVRDLPQRPIALTLFRSTRRTVMTAGEPNGQLLGSLGFRFAIQPLAENLPRTELGELGLQLAGGLRTVALDARDLATRRSEAARLGKALPSLSPEGSLLALEGEALLSSVQLHEEALQVRLWNPYDSPTFVGLQTTTQSDDQSWKCFELDGREMEAESEPLKLEAKKIATLRLT